MSDARIIQRGIASLQTTAGALDAYPNVAMQAMKAKQVWDNNMVKDFGGFEFGWDARNSHIILTLDYELTGASYALAIVNGAFLLPFAQVAITGSDLPWINATGVGGLYTGNWCYSEGGDLNLSNTKQGNFTLTLRKFADATQNSAQFSTPS